jgi:tol-pal system protein YbgF
MAGFSTSRRQRAARLARRCVGASCAFACAVLCTACVTPAEFRKLERRVIDMQRQGGGGASGDAARIAEMGVQIDTLQHSVDELKGRIEVAEHHSEEALEEARAARAQAGQPSAAETPDAGGGETPGDSEEVLAYRAAYAEWRSGDSQACIDRFSKFLQTYPSSEYADDATYWLADCYFKQGNFSAAVLRFDDVARQYPSGNKAPDALYRQGEALLRMGHGQAAGNAFERVLRDYPNSARAREAKRQLDLLRSG